MMVKICGITNREDALAAVEAGASAIGFNFYRESPRYISHTGAAMIAEKIPANVWKVGVFVNESPDVIAKAVLDAGLDVAQLCGTSNARGIRIWRVLPANSPITDSVTESAEALLIDTPSDQVFGGTGKDLGLERRSAARSEDYYCRRSGRDERPHRHRTSPPLGSGRVLPHRKIPRPKRSR